VLSITNPQNLQQQTYKFEPDNHLHGLWHIEEQPNVEQLLDSP
jgi:hypothetical protein